MTSDEKKRFENMEERLSDIDNKVDEILTALKGDNLGTSDGLVQEFKAFKDRVKELEAYNRKLENMKLKLIWLAMGAGLAAGFTIDKIWGFIIKILG